MPQARTPPASANRSRRSFILAACAGLFVSPAIAQDAPPVVTLLGDSIMAGYGLAESDGLASRLEVALAELGARAEVRNAGLPGDTSAGGRARLHMSVRKDTAVCVVAFGGNDRRLGYPLSLTRDMLTAIVRELKAQGVAVVLASMRGGELGDLHRQLSESADVLLVSGLLEGLGPEHIQPDRVHPNADGEDILAQRLAPVVAEALRAPVAGASHRTTSQETGPETSP